MQGNPGQSGPGNILRDQTDGRILHPWVSQIKRRSNGRAKPTLQQSCSVLPAITTICGGEHPTFWAKHCQLPAGYRGAAILYHRMLPRPQGHLDNREYCHITQRATQRIKDAGGGGLQRQPIPARGRLEGGGYCGSTDGSGTGRHVVPLPPPMMPMV